MLIKGAVPGSKGGWVEVRDAIKGTKVDELPLPGSFTKPTLETPKKDKKTSDKPAGGDTPKSSTDFVDAVILIDGIGPKGEEVLKDAGITKLTELVALSAEALASLEEKIGKPGVAAKEEWIEQAKEMIGGAEPRAEIDKKLAAKMRTEASKGEEE